MAFVINCNNCGIPIYVTYDFDGISSGYNYLYCKKCYKKVLSDAKNDAQQYIKNTKHKEPFIEEIALDTGMSAFVDPEGFHIECKRVADSTVYYTGIGARKTPPKILDLFTTIGKEMAEKGYILRSGGAKGADQAFEKGCDLVGGKKEIYLPWRGFEGSTSRLIVRDRKAFEIAEKFHPYWHNLSVGARKLQARNSHQVLGQNLDAPSVFVICWTEGGLGKGGTGQALRIARHYKIPIYDLALQKKKEARFDGEFNGSCELV